MWTCERCGSGYLDPRPSPDTIGLAYGRYYTHETGSVTEPTSPLSWLRQAVGNDYRNARFNMRLHPALPLIGRLIVKLAPRTRRRIDRDFRFLPYRSTGARLLDVGCGNGDYLRMARKAGWRVAGTEPDPQARNLACSDGMDVRESFRDWDASSESFDYITASHVIEHVHDPDEFLKDIAKLLAPDGCLFLQTPNVDAVSHRQFGPYWRGLEPPRHLLLFNKESLRATLLKAGFRSARFIAIPEAADWLSNQSNRIANGQDPNTGQQVSDPPAKFEPRPDSSVSDGTEDFLTVVATQLPSVED
jgi:2-polyprenyl-3-methyl-5-hydroxy-6-metoxy-1,4-benzoquinol methylase